VSLKPHNPNNNLNQLSHNQPNQKRKRVCSVSGDDRQNTTLLIISKKKKKLLQI